jgi:CYTH domain-containing protein
VNKFAHLEWERKFRLNTVEFDLMTMPGKRITDIYIPNTSLRLRRMSDANHIAYKLTKKISMVPGENELTTIYLTASEFSVFNFAEMVLVEKTRYIVASNHHNIGIDEYGTGGQKVFIAEIEFSDRSTMESFTPFFADHVEVTHSIEYNGYELALRFGKTITRSL